MALLDFLKRKKQIEKAKPAEKTPSKPAEKKAEKVLDVKKTESKNKPVEISGEVIKGSHISEKATNLAEKNKYTFKITKNANKPQIKKSIESAYKVNVLSVNIIKIPEKKRRIGRTEGFKKGYSKAIVTIKEGQKIEVL